MNAHANGVAAEDATEVGTSFKLYAAHQRELHASGITVEAARTAGIHSEHDRRKLAAHLGWKSWPQKYGAALVFPVRDLDGNTIFHRVKPERPPVQNGKPRKYLQPSGVKSHAYFPPGVAEKIADNTVELLVTEGEKKALSATQHGFTTIGLTGVWNWKPAGKVSALLPEIERIEWHGRKAFIAFDSDVVDNSQVMSAEQQLAATLQARGAIVKIIRLPGADDGAKQGLDDYIVAKGAGALQRLKDEAADPEPIDAGTFRDAAKNMDPASVAGSFAKAIEVDNEQRLRFWRGQWWYWERGGFRELTAEDLRAKVVEFVNERYLDVAKSHIANVMMHLESHALIPAHIEAPCWLGKERNSKPSPAECIATKSGVVHLASYVARREYLTNPTPKFFTTSSVGYAFNATPPEPEHWLAFLHSLWPDDEPSIDLLQRWFGYCLTADTRQQKALMVIGPKRSGKGTIARVLTALVGKANVAGPTLSSLSSNFGLWPLIGKSLAIISDARLSGRADQAVVVERLLSVTGEDMLTIDRKNLSLLTCKLPTRFVILTNELPRLGDASGAMASRLMLLHTPNSFYGREDHDLTDRLLGELPGILKWAIDGWRLLRDEKRFNPPASSEELTGQMADLSSPISAFVRDRCLVGVNYQVDVGLLFKSWKEWCEDANLRPGDKAKFGRDLSACLPQLTKQRPRVNGKRQHIYGGIGLDGEWLGHGGHSDQL